MLGCAGKITRRRRLATFTLPLQGFTGNSFLQLVLKEFPLSSVLILSVGGDQEPCLVAEQLTRATITPLTNAGSWIDGLMKIQGEWEL